MTYLNRMFNSTLLLFLFSGLCLAQTGTVARRARLPSTSGGSGDLILTGGAMPGTLAVASGSASVSNAIWVDGTGSLVWGGSGNTRSETRKDDGKGPTLQQVDASAKLLAKAKLPSARYRELALAIGLNPSPITDEVEILQAIDELGMHVYDFDHVDNYLYRKALRQGTNVRWVWKPLREADLKAAGGWSTHANAGIVYPSQYSQPIPENVLEHVSEFIGKVPNAVVLVSDYEVINPDPFLAVTTEKLLGVGKMWIIERWDEPGYRETDGAPQVNTARAAK